MRQPLDMIPSDEVLPKAVDVVVVGGGIAGVCASYWLAKQGVSVALVEKGVIAGEQSSRNWGWCRQQGRDKREIPLIRHSVEMWAGMDREIGADVGFQRAGVAYAQQIHTTGGMGRMGRLRARTPGAQPRAEQRSGRRIAAGFAGEVARRIAHANRWTRRAFEGRSGDRGCGARPKVRRSIRIVRRVVWRCRRVACRRSLPRGAVSQRVQCCVPAAHGARCSVVDTASACLSYRCARPCCKRQWHRRWQGRMYPRLAFRSAVRRTMVISSR